MHFFSDKTDRYHVNFEQLKCLTVCVAFFQLYYANSTSVTCTNERMSTGLCISSMEHIYKKCKNKLPAGELHTLCLVRTQLLSELKTCVQVVTMTTNSARLLLISLLGARPRA